VRSALALACAACLAGCAGPGAARRAAPAPEAGAAPAATEPSGVAAAAVPAALAAPPAPASSAIDPEVLLPAADSTDDVVARVGDIAIHERHVYEHLLKTEPAAPRKLVEVMVLDAQVAQAARLWGISLDGPEVERLAGEQENKLRADVTRQLGESMSFERYLERQFGMSIGEYRDWLRTKLIRELYRQYVLRYAALREERVEVRYIVNADRKVLDDVEEKVRQGASFATLAQRHTEDQNRMDGGLLPPFGRGFDHPVADVALGLSIGELSEVFMREVQGAKRWYLVYCLRRIPGRAVEFATVKEEIERDMESHPLTEMEFRAASLALQSALGTLNSGGTGR
jgi:parvulin-like peptidyl-prolyl isomerase